MHIRGRHHLQERIAESREGLHQGPDWLLPSRPACQTRRRRHGGSQFGTFNKPRQATPHIAQGL